MLGATFAKGAAANIPAPHAAGENHLHCLRAARRPIEAASQSELVAGAPQQTHRRLGQQFLSGTIHQSQTLITIKRKNGYVDLAHDRAQECRRLERAHSLVTQSLPEVVYLEHDFTQSVAGGGAPAANGVIAFAYGGENIGQSLQRPNDSG